MMLAQKLYEAGNISYMRTDSTNFLDEAVLAIRKTIKDEFGDKYFFAAQNIRLKPSGRKKLTKQYVRLILTGKKFLR